METVNQSWAEILEGGFQVLWPVMDDEQKLALVRYAKPLLGKRTRDGVRMTWDRFGQAVGATGKALSEHHRRWEGPKTSSPTRDREMEAARRVARNQALPVEQRTALWQELGADPEVVERGLDVKQASDPASPAAKAVGNVARAMIQAKNQGQARLERRQVESPVARSGSELKSINDLKGALYRHAREVSEALSSVGELGDGERVFLENALESSEKQNQKVRKYIELGRTEFDVELESLLESEK